MKNFALLVATVHLLSCTQLIWAKKCLLTKKVECPCGLSDNTVQTSSEWCVEVQSEFVPSICEPCELKNHADPCKNFTYCQECDADSRHCLYCPAGRTGSFCDIINGNVETAAAKDSYSHSNLEDSSDNEDEEEESGNRGDTIGYPFLSALHGKDEDEDSSSRRRKCTNDEQSDGFGEFPVEVTIPRGQSISKNRYLRSASECFFPDHMDTAEIRCTIWPSYTKCNITCIWGHTLPAGRMVSIKCRNRENTWKPYGFRECEPYVDCSLRLRSPGSINCVYNRLEDPISCDIMCNEYDDIPEVPKKEYACTLQGNFAPPLPFCVEKANNVLHGAHSLSVRIHPTVTVAAPTW